MSLSLQSDATEVARFVESHGLSPEPFLRAKITGALLGALNGTDMVNGGYCTLLGEGLRLLAFVRLSFAPEPPPYAVVRVQEMDPTLISAWLCSHGQTDMAEKFKKQNICGMGMLLITPSDLLWLECDNEAIDIFFRERQVLSASDDSEEEEELTTAGIPPCPTHEFDPDEHCTHCQQWKHAMDTVIKDEVPATEIDATHAEDECKDASENTATSTHRTEAVGVVSKAAPSTPPPKKKDAPVSMVSPLKRRRAEVTPHQKGSIHFQGEDVSTPRADIEFGEQVELEKVYNTMCGHFDTVVLIVTWQDAPHLSQWKGTVVGKLSSMHGDLDPLTNGESIRV